MNGYSIRPHNPSGITLTELSSRFQLNQRGEATTHVTGITLSSRDVRPGDLYVGMPGALRHGADFSAQAEAQGAVAVLTDSEGARKCEGLQIPVLVTSEHPRLLLGQVSASVYGTESLEAMVFGVTGTNGKTSVVYMLDAFLQLAGYTTGISTTAERRIGEIAMESNLTSPEASELHGLLARMNEEHVNAIALEVSAQAVKRNRIDGVRFDVVSFNNLSQDHLDEFGDMETYYQSKLALFTPEHARKGVAVVDTQYGARLARESEIPVTTLATEYGNEADWHLAITSHTLDGVSFVLQGPDNAYLRARVPLFGRFMAENAAVAFIMLHEAGVDTTAIVERLKSEPLPVVIPGRLELINPGSDGPKFYVDYGHTPGSFSSMLEALEEVTDGKIIFMFGADGDRDTTKREEMGRIAAEGSDILIVCDYHPRFEDPAAIRAQLLTGARQSGTNTHIHEIADPRAAIRAAIEFAGPEDIIIYAGPGHESYQEIAGNMLPYSARDEVRGALREAGLLT